MSEEEYFTSDEDGASTQTVTTYSDLAQHEQQALQDGAAMRCADTGNGLSLEESIQAQLLCEKMETSIDNYTNEDGTIDADKLIEDAIASSETKSLEEFSYLTRGAKLRCRFGSHIRMLNLPECHGVYTMNCPMAYEMDCIPGDDQNIAMFGVCSSKSNPSGDEIVLQLTRYDELGNVVQESYRENVKGKPCLVDIVGHWMAAYHRTYIAKNLPDGNRSACEACPKAIKGDDAFASITTNSFLVCRYGGLIEAVTGGTEYHDEHQGYPEGTQFLSDPDAPPAVTTI